MKVKTEIDLEVIDELIKILKFYSEGKNYEWDGCSCHGHYERIESGDLAIKGINLLSSMKPRCSKCNYFLGLDGCCDNDFCDNFYIRA